MFSLLNALLGLASMAGFAITVIVILISAIRRKPLKVKMLVLLGFVVLFLIAVNTRPTDDSEEEPTGTTTSTVSADTYSTEDSGVFISPTENLEELEQIDSGITDTLLSVGYTIDHASSIQGILNTIGITEIEIESMTGQAESGLNSVVCYPNGYTDRNRRFYFTTEDGVLFYAGFRDEDLYDSENGGYLKNYSDVHVPETEVTLDVYNDLQALAIEAVKDYLNYPDTASFGYLDWAIGRSDDKYQIRGTVTAKNGFGVEDNMPFAVWFTANDGGYTVEAITIDGTRVK